MHRTIVNIIKEYQAKHGRKPSRIHVVKQGLDLIGIKKILGVKITNEVWG